MAINSELVNKYSLSKLTLIWAVGLIALFNLQISKAASEVATTEMAADEQSTILIRDIKMPKVPPVSRTAAIYLVVENNGKQAVYLTNVTTKAAHHAMIHKTENNDGVASMGHVERLRIAPHGRVEFSPGGYHIMLMGLNTESLKKPFTVTFEFDRLSPQTFTVEY